MTISGFLENFSLPELLRVIDLGSKSGRLILQVRSAPKNPELVGLYHIWFQKGRLVTIINRLNHQSLVTQIENRGWLSEFVSQKIKSLYLPEFPLGLYLQQVKLLTEQQLNSLFQIHLEQVYQLFEVPVGFFLFHDISLQDQSGKKRKIPWLEMTGRSIRATEASLNALRLQKNWDIFAEQLPEASYAIERLVNQPHFELISIEQKIWELANGQITLQAMANKINQPLPDVQKTAFRLIMAGLIEEVPIVVPSINSVKNFGEPRIDSSPRLSSSNPFATTTSQSQQSNQTNELNTSFLKTVVNFLRRKFG